jgi:hypothetical protein
LTFFTPPAILLGWNNFIDNLSNQMPAKVTRSGGSRYSKKTPRVSFFGGWNSPKNKEVKNPSYLRRNVQNLKPNPEIAAILGLNKKDKKLSLDNLKLQNIKGSTQKYWSGLILTLKKSRQKINYFFLSFLQRLKKAYFNPKTQFLIVFTFILSITLGFFYFSFFSSFFLVKSYRVKFTTESYIDKQSLRTLTANIRKTSLFPGISANHFWYQNSQSLTEIAKNTNPSISQIEIKNKVWPNESILEITTKPILATLKINEEYYIISQSGQVIGLDEGGLRLKVINVATFQKNLNTEQLSQIFLNANVDNQFDSESKTQLNRLYYIDLMRNELLNRQYNLARVDIMTLFENDADVYFSTAGGTVLVFDSKNISIASNLNRLDILTQTTNLGQDIKDGKIKNLDLRFKGKVYICYRNSECINNPALKV